MSDRLRVGVDMGGTKIEAIALDAVGTTLARRRVPTPVDDYDETVRAIRDVVLALEDETGRRGTVGVGIPGTVSPASGKVKNANSTWLIGRPFDHDLSSALGRDIRMANDANCFAVSEATDGAAAGAPVVFGVIAGTGVGGGLVVDGKVLAGPHGIGGEWGHNPLPWPTPDELPGRPCYCGKSGCIETWLSGPGLAADYDPAGTGGTDAPSIVALARNGDGPARAALERYLDRMARALAGVINILDPDIIVLGGGMSNVDELYDDVPQRLGDYVFSDVITTPIVKNRHGDSSGVRGAAWLWPKTVNSAT